jgi:hypothetical protein
MKMELRRACLHLGIPEWSLLAIHCCYRASQKLTPGFASFPIRHFTPRAFQEITMCLVFSREGKDLWRKSHAVEIFFQCWDIDGVFLTSLSCWRYRSFLWLNLLIRLAIHCLSCFLQCRGKNHSLDVVMFQENPLNVELLSGQRGSLLRTGKPRVSRCITLVSSRTRWESGNHRKDEVNLPPSLRGVLFKTREYRRQNWPMKSWVVRDWEMSDIGTLPWPPTPLCFWSKPLGVAYPTALPAINEVTEELNGKEIMTWKSNPNPLSKKFFFQRSIHTHSIQCNGKRHENTLIGLDYHIAISVGNDNSMGIPSEG